MKILQVITDTDRRGAQLFAVDLGLNLGKLGNSVTTVALAPGSLPDPLEVETLGVRARSLKSLLSLRRLAASVDVTIAHGSSTCLACAVSGTRFVYRQIGDTRYWARGLSRRLRVHAYLSRSERIVALSEGARNDLRDHLWLGTREIAVVPNGADSTVFVPPTDDQRAKARVALGLDPDRPVVLCIGGLDPAKGVDLAIAAVAEIPTAQLLVVGDGVERRRLAELAGEKCPGRVSFSGHLSNTAPAYHAADIVTMPSRGADSMPAVVIEAGLCGLPVVATDVGAVREVIRHGSTGTVVKSDSLVDLVSAVRMYLHDEARRAAVGRAAREYYCARFDSQVVAGLWQSVLLDCVAGRK